ncbi:hypothetical protein E2C01_065060 [Portunus trituberculatus]|uniref:Uncharacterized protein n=1 Tax=Portunus trituberculatus TaxID=210409 RepID=A0A5B7HDH0_PORTR|nr:hypothetical protein [Portunus trituberculatus]
MDDDLSSDDLPPLPHLSPLLCYVIHQQPSLREEQSRSPDKSKENLERGAEGGEWDRIVLCWAAKCKRASSDAPLGS